ncbi:MAG: large conductance mechanosensitive channel protein MscL [Candidatus Roizmanbacteria bacterium]
MEGFKKFILRGNVVELAVGVVIGASFNNVVNSFVGKVLTPILGLIGGQPNFSSFTIRFGQTRIQIGDFFSALLSFLIISTVVYFFVVLPMNRLTSALLKKTSDEETKKCRYCLSNVPINATKCAFCTSDISQA